MRSILLQRPDAEKRAASEPLARRRYIEKPDLQKLRASHERLASAFRDLDVEVAVRKAEATASLRLVKSMYTRDPAFAVLGGVIIGRMYDALRRSEESWAREPAPSSAANRACAQRRRDDGGRQRRVGHPPSTRPSESRNGVISKASSRSGKVVNAADPAVDVRFVEVKHPSGHLDVPLTMVNVQTAVLDARSVPTPSLNG